MTPSSPSWVSPKGGDPTLTLRDDEAQQLLDALWRAGVRPSDDVGSTGHLSALQDHLKDMRQLVAAFMELNK